MPSPYSTMNEYVRAYTLDDYSRTPKNVAVALAMSLAMRLCEDNVQAARHLLNQEWSTLHANGIIKQKPINIVAPATHATEQDT